MNRWAYQQNAFLGGCVADGVVCPKPRRIGAPLPFHEPLRPTSRLLHFNNQSAELYDAKVGTELLDITRLKGVYGVSPSSTFQVASSPPFFIGSPPIRASNPIIQDEQFGSENGDCVRANIGPKAAGPVRRIEGFNCCGTVAFLL